MNEGTVVRCAMCSTPRALGEMNDCAVCGLAVCSGDDAFGCTGRCGCVANRHAEHPEDAKTYYSLTDEMNAGNVDRVRAAFIECQLDLIEHRCGW
jgi:hypothetical protein